MNDERSPHVTVDDAPSEADLEAVRAGLRAHNAITLGPTDSRPLDLVLRGRDGAVLGGLAGETARGWLWVGALWVDEGVRGEGWGSRLLEAAEREAVARGCRRARLDTATFQAPGFYERHGYREVFRDAEAFPGHDIVFYRKDLLPVGGDG